MFKDNLNTTSPSSANQFGLHHPRFGNLSNNRSIFIDQPKTSQFVFVEKPFSYIHLSVTGRCYARCKGCINSSITSPYPETAPVTDTRPERDATCIITLLQARLKDEAAICFYGGEPLMVADKINTIVEIVNQADLPHPVHYMLYTNGNLLQKSINEYPNLMDSIWLFSISIDGMKAQHEKIRIGTDLNKIHAGLEELNNIRTGTVLMWSTLREEQSLLDCFYEFMEQQEKGTIDQFFWHWVETDEPFEHFSSYAKKYEDDLKTIMDNYMAWLSNGKILPIVHINELILYLLTGKKRNSSACGVELADNFDLIGGKIHSCADLPMHLAIGTIDDQGIPHFSHKDLSSLVAYKKDIDCYSCGVHFYCGGRCPVQAYTGCIDRVLQYCQLMRLHVGIVKDYIDDIIVTMELRKISSQQLYDASAFYAQFTDVTP